jgi:hypothetical protein
MRALTGHGLRLQCHFLLVVRHKRFLRLAHLPRVEQHIERVQIHREFLVQPIAQPHQVLQNLPLR